LETGCVSDFRSRQIPTSEKLDTPYHEEALNNQANIRNLRLTFDRRQWTHARL